jgi:hypothetical protein
MKSPLARVSVTILAGVCCLFGVPDSLTAQVPSTPEAESDNGSLDDLPDDPNQMNIWTCLQENKKIEVEAQDESIWKEIIEKSGWECSQQIPNQAGGDIQFSCEPEEGTLGILTFTWLEGEGGKEQMQVWMEELADRPDMNCQMGTVQPWDTEEDVEQQ